MTTVEPYLSEPQLSGCSDYPANGSPVLINACRRRVVYIQRNPRYTMASSSRKPTKRKCIVLPIESRMAILDRLKGGASYKRLADDFGIGISTIGDIKRNDTTIRAFVSTMDNMAMSKKGRKVMRLASDDKLDEAVYQWFVQKRSQDMPLCKAVQLHGMLNKGGAIAPFQASRAWLWQFCNRHGIRLQGEKVSPDTTAVEPFKAELQQLIEHENLTLTQLYNCDETGLCYRMLPSKSLASRSKKEASGMKKQKDHVT